jgi:signal transduction histidine kinase
LSANVGALKRGSKQSTKNESHSEETFSKGRISSGSISNGSVGKERERAMHEMNQAMGQQTAAQVDPTERRRVDAVVETLAKLRSEGESLAGLAHDARNMVTALALYCDLLEEPGVLAAQFMHYANELRLVAAASRRLVEKLVSLDVRGNAVRGVTGFGITGQPNSLGGSAVKGAAGSGFEDSGFKGSGLDGPGLEGPGFEDRALEAAWEDTSWENTLGAAADRTLSGNGTGSGTGPATGLATARASSPIPNPATNPAAGLAAPLRTGIVPAGHWDLMPPELISNLAQELLLSRNLLSALAGPSIALTVDVEGGALPVRLNAEDLTRVLVNLVKNAAEAMPGGGSIRIGLCKRYDPTEAGAGNRSEVGPDTGPEIARGCQLLSLTIEDSGPGIQRKALERIFEAGFTTRSAQNSQAGGWPTAHRGLGLSISRSIMEAAGGRIYATNLEGPDTPGRGARFEIVLPVRGR